MFRIIDFTPETAPAALWKDYYYFYKITTGNFSILEDFKKRTLQTSKDKATQYKLIYKNDILVCAVGFRLNPGVDGDKIPILLFTCGPAELPHGFDCAVADTILQFSELYPATNWQVRSASPVIHDIARALGGEIRNVINFYELTRRGFDEDVMADWHNNDCIQSGELTYAFCEYIPEHLQGQFAALITDLTNDINGGYPIERFKETREGVAAKMDVFKQTGVKMLTLMLFDQAQQLAGLSFILQHPDWHAARQEMTGIARPWRGRHLAAWLKGTITAKAFRQFTTAETIAANCQAENTAIIHVNEQIGYRPGAQCIRFEVQVDDLVQFTSEV